MSKPLIPPPGRAYLGAFVDLPGLTPAASVLERESQLGRKFAIDSHYYGWGDPFPGQPEQADVAAGRIPLAAWAPGGVTLTEIASGSQDATILAHAKAAKAFGHPMFIRWGIEMNGNWYAWSGDPALYAEAWQHIWHVFAAQGVTNVAWVWAPNADSHPGGTDPTSPNNWTHYYPGDGYVDWVGIDGYNWGQSNGNSWQTPSQIFDPVALDYVGRKPVMIAETASVEKGGSKAEWIDQLAAWVESTKVKALVWFDTNQSSSGIDWRTDSSVTSFAAFRALAAQPYFAA